jgi:hypothetical protein
MTPPGLKARGFRVKPHRAARLSVPRSRRVLPGGTWRLGVFNGAGCAQAFRARRLPRPGGPPDGLTITAMIHNLRLAPFFKTHFFAMEQFYEREEPL